MLHGRIRFTLSLGITLLALLAAPMAHGQVQGPKPSSSDSKISYTLVDPVTEQMVNTCNGETVDLTGELVYTYHSDIKPDGDTHIVIDAVTKLTGVGETTGAKYVSRDTIHSNFRLDPATNINLQATQKYTQTDKLKLVAQGPTPDLTTVQVTHWSINSSGVLVTRDHPTISKCSH